MRLVGSPQPTSSLTAVHMHGESTSCAAAQSPWAVGNDVSGGLLADQAVLGSHGDKINNPTARRCPIGPGNPGNCARDLKGRRPCGYRIVAGSQSFCRVSLTPKLIRRFSSNNRNSKAARGPKHLRLFAAALSDRPAVPDTRCAGLIGVLMFLVAAAERAAGDLQS
jgi:hypothetical protein